MYTRIAKTDEFESAVIVWVADLIQVYNELRWAVSMTIVNKRVEKGLSLSVFYKTYECIFTTGKAK